MSKLWLRKTCCTIGKGPVVYNEETGYYGCACCGGSTQPEPNRLSERFKQITEMPPEFALKENKETEVKQQ